MAFYSKFAAGFIPLSMCVGLILLFTSTSHAQTRYQNTPKIAIIIDDVGHRSVDRRLQELPIEVAFSILPDADFATYQANLAKQGGRDVMIHMPMESLIPSQDLGNSPLLVSMPQDELEQTIASALDKVPGAVGINNHMGSKFTQLKSTMAAFFASLQAQNTELFFVDSRTTPFTRAYQQAREFSIPAVERNVFLDHIYNEDAIAKEFARLVKKAKQEGSALAIGHPNRQTLEYLQTHLPKLEAQGVELVSITEYVAMHQATKVEIAQSASVKSPAVQNHSKEGQVTPLP